MSGRIFLFALLFAAGLKTQSDATDANVVSPVITYQYLDVVGEQTNVPVTSPVITYQYLDAVGTQTYVPVVSPVVFYQYLDVLPNATYQTQTSPSVVYYYQNGNQAGPVIAGVSPNPVPGIDGAQTFTISGSNFNGSSVVNLTNLTTGISYPNQAILTENGTQIVIKPNFGTTACTWTVQVANGLIFSSPYQFTVQAATNGTLQAPVMNSPGAVVASGDVQVNPAISFSWQLVSGADRYDIFISQLDTSGGYDPVFSTQTSGISLSGTTNSFTLPPGVLKSGGSFRWTMSTHNSAGSGAPSPVFRYFRTPVATAVLPPPALGGPGNNVPPGQSVNSTTPQFTWQAVNGADGYDIHVSMQNPDGTYSSVFDTHALGLTQSAGARSYAMPSGYLQPGHRYLWQMSTQNSAGNGPQNTPGLYIQTGTAPANPPLKITWLILSPSQADWCQTITFQGKVVDDNGNAVSGAILTAADPLASGPLLSPQSNQGGFISFPLTVPVNTANGTYTYSLQATKAGYTPSANWLVQLQVSHTSATPAVSINTSIVGSSVPLGSTQVLTATATGSVMAYSFALSIDGGLNWLPLGRIANPTSNMASIIVPILGGLSAQCLFKVTADYLDGSHTATSDAFSIVDPGLSAPYQIPGFGAYRQSQLHNDVPIGMQTTYTYTISGVGCNLTCLSMMLNFYKAPNSPYTPRTLNDTIHESWIWGANEKNQKVLLDTAAAVKYLYRMEPMASRLKWQMSPTNYTYTGDGPIITSPFGHKLKEIVAQGMPVKVLISGVNGVKDNTHYVIVYGWDARGFIIADSAVDLAAGKSEDPWYFESNYPMNQASWNNSFSYIRSYDIWGWITPEASQTTQNGKESKSNEEPTTEIEFSIFDTADLLVTDPNGSQTGFSLAAGGIVHQIPNAMHYVDSLTDATTGESMSCVNHVCDLSTPISGTYTVSVTGVDTGPYVLRIRQARSGRSIKINYIDGVAAPGSVDSYILQVGTTADLSLTGTAPPAFVQGGSTVTYSWTVSNNGAGQASAVTLTDTLPPGCSLISAQPERYQYDSSAGTVTFGIGNLSPGTSQTISLTVTADTGGTGTNTAVVSSFEPDINPDDNMVTASTTVVPAVTFAGWQAAHFAATQLQDPAICGPWATPQADGVSNLLKFAFDISPSGPMNASDRAGLPAVGMQTRSGLRYLTLTYRRNFSATGLSYHLQRSLDLASGSWVNVTPDSTSASAPDPLTGDAFVTDMLNVTGLDRAFIRLSVDYSMSLVDWQTSNFTRSQLNDSTISGPLAVPQADGIPNLLKYAFDISPSAPASAPDRTALPSVGMQTRNGLRYLTLTYRKNVEADGIRFDLQKSPNLLPGCWTTINPDVVLQSVPDAAGDVFVTDMLNVTGTDKAFIRLSVTQP